MISFLFVFFFLVTFFLWLVTATYVCMLSLKYTHIYTTQPFNNITVLFLTEPEHKFKNMCVCLSYHIFYRYLILRWHFPLNLFFYLFLFLIHPFASIFHTWIPSILIKMYFLLFFVFCYLLHTLGSIYDTQHTSYSLAYFPFKLSTIYQNYWKFSSLFYAFFFK